MALAYRHDRTPMPDGPLTEEELAREHRSLGILAWFDGWGQALGMPPIHGDYPRRLDAREQAEWREGHAQGVADRKDTQRREAEWAAWREKNLKTEGAGRGRRPRNADRA